MVKNKCLVRVFRSRRPSKEQLVGCVKRENESASNMRDHASATASSHGKIPARRKWRYGIPNWFLFLSLTSVRHLITKVKVCPSLRFHSGASIYRLKWRDCFYVGYCDELKTFWTWLSIHILRSSRIKIHEWIIRPLQTYKVRVWCKSESRFPRQWPEFHCKIQHRNFTTVPSVGFSQQNFGWASTLNVLAGAMC